MKVLETTNLRKHFMKIELTSEELCTIVFDWYNREFADNLNFKYDKTNVSLSLDGHETITAIISSSNLPEADHE